MSNSVEIVAARRLGITFVGSGAEHVPTSHVHYQSVVQRAPRARCIRFQERPQGHLVAMLFLARTATSDVSKSGTIKISIPTNSMQLTSSKHQLLVSFAVLAGKEKRRKVEIHVEFSR